MASFAIEAFDMPLLSDEFRSATTGGRTITIEGTNQSTSIEKDNVTDLPPVPRSPLTEVPEIPDPQPCLVEWTFRCELELLIVLRRERRDSDPLETIRANRSEYLGYLDSEPCSVQQEQLCSESRGFETNFEADWLGVRHCIAQELQGEGVLAVADVFPTRKPGTNAVGRGHGDVAGENQCDGERDGNGSDGSRSNGHNLSHEQWKILRRVNVYGTSNDVPVLGHGSRPTFYPVTVHSPWVKFTAGSLGLVMRACTALRNKFLVYSHDNTHLRIRIRPAAGSEGVRGRDNGFPEEVLANIARLLWHASPALDTLHPTRCGARSAHCPGIEMTRTKLRFDVLRMAVPKWGRRDVAEEVPTFVERVDQIQLLPVLPDLEHNRDPLTWFKSKCETIMREETLTDILRYFSVPNGTFSQKSFAEGEEGEIVFLPAYNFQSFLGHRSPPELSDRDLPSIEFRQHAGTTDPAAVAHWIRLCVGICDFAWGAPSANLQELGRRLTRLADEETAACAFDGLLRIMEEIGLGPEAAHYRSRGPHAAPTECERKHHWRDALEYDFSGEPLEFVTFGVEMEFLAPNLGERGRVDIPDPHPEDPRWFCHTTTADPGYPHRDAFLKIVTLVDELGLLGFNDEVSRTVDSKAVEGQWVLREGFTFDAAQTWECEDDISIHIRQREQLPEYTSSQGIELKTPALRARTSSYAELLRVLTAVRSQMRLYTHHTCGLHVHVGVPDGYSALSIKRLATVWWLAEDVFYSLCHPRRYRAGTYAYPIRLLSELAKKRIRGQDPLRPFRLGCFKDSDREAVREILEHVPAEILASGFWGDGRSNLLPHQLWDIWRSKDMGRLFGLFHCGARGGVTFLRLHMYDDGTVEFRLRESTLDPGLIIRWVMLLAAVVRFCVNASPSEFRRLVGKLASKEGRSRDQRLRDLLEGVDAGRFVSFWQQVATANDEILLDGLERERQYWRANRREAEDSLADSLEVAPAGESAGEETTTGNETAAGDQEAEQDESLLQQQFEAHLKRLLRNRVRGGRIFPDGEARMEVLPEVSPNEIAAIEEMLKTERLGLGDFLHLSSVDFDELCEEIS